jgi:ATP-dependent DNA helicase DinG
MTELIDKKYDLMHYWNIIMPDNAPRRSQMETFDWIESLSPHIKYILLEMPVGGGKSPVGLTISAWMNQGYGSSFILTPQKVLQKQYEDSFSDKVLFSMYGKSNYHCKGKDVSCESGATIKPKCKECPQRTAFQRAIISNNLVLNYSLAMLYFMHVDKIEPRNLMIMDECHNLETQLVNFTTLDVSEYMCERMKKIKYKEPANITEAHAWIKDEYLPCVDEYIMELQEEVRRIEHFTEHNPNMKLTKTDESTLKTNIMFKRHRDKIIDVTEQEVKELVKTYVLIPSKGKFSLKELYGKNAFNNIMKPMADKFLFMSSTILNKDGFCADLGINPEETAFLSLESEFAPENRPVIYSPKAKMNYGWDTDKRKGDRERMIEGIRNALETHSDVSGIIHTGSFKMSKWIIDELYHHTAHNIIHHNPYDGMRGNRDDAIDDYMRSAKAQPTLLISPSITEGLDLKDEIGRFAIFAKVPYPSLGDNWIKRRMEISSNWYQRQTLKEIIQGSGRICRTPNDWGVTYILDASFTYLYNSTKEYTIPQWWKDSFHVV